jgi:hypothetical protein
MKGAGKAVGGDCGRMALMAASTTGSADIAYWSDPMAGVDGGDHRQNRAPKAFVNVYSIFLSSSRDFNCRPALFFTKKSLYISSKSTQRKVLKSGA